MRPDRPTRAGCLIAIAALAVACSDENQVSVSGAKQVEPPAIPRNARGLTVEQQNIYDRIRVTCDPTKVMWMHLLALDGRVVRRMPVRCKTSSSGKRLEPRHAAASNKGQNAFPAYNGQETTELLQADGTYGESDDYQFWFDPLGRYHQCGSIGGLGYLLTDYPIDLDTPSDPVTGLYSADVDAQRWQVEQETNLRQLESGKR